MPDKKKKNIFEKIWDFFASVKLAIVILSIIAVTSIIGTVIEQNVEPAKNIKFLSGIVGDNAAPTVYNLFLKLDFMDMYHSWWFTSLLILFSINLTVCTLEHFPKTWRLVNSPLKPLRDNAIRNMPLFKDAVYKADIKKVRDTFFNALAAKKYQVFEDTEGEGFQLYTHKGRYSRLGFYIVHISLLLIFAGAIIGAQYGFDGHISLPEGSATSIVYSRSGEKIPLDFVVKCNWYRTDYYKGSDTPQEFSSELVVYDETGEVLKKVIEVNDPLQYKGITFYQSSYGMVPDAVGEFILNVTPSGRQTEKVRMSLGDSFEIAGTNIKGTIVDFSPALGRDPNTGKLTTYAETMVNPAIAVNFELTGGEEKKKFTGWILNRYPDTGILPGGHVIEFEDYWGVEYTGLQVSKDPGVIIIYIACIIMVIGLYVSFFMTHKKIWIRVVPESSGKKSSVRVSIGATATKNKIGLEHEIEHLISKASKEIE